MYTCTNSTVAIVIDSGHFSVVTQVSYSVYIYTNMDIPYMAYTFSVI